MKARASTNQTLTCLQCGRTMEVYFARQDRRAQASIAARISTCPTTSGSNTCPPALHQTQRGRAVPGVARISDKLNIYLVVLSGRESFGLQSSHV